MSRDDYDDDDSLDDDEELDDDDEQLGSGQPRPASPFTTSSSYSAQRGAAPGDAGRTSASGSGHYGATSNLPGGQRGGSASSGSYSSGQRSGGGSYGGSGSSGARPTSYSGSSSGSGGSDPRGGSSGSYSGSGARPTGYSGSTSSSGGSGSYGSGGSGGSYSGGGSGSYGGSGSSGARSPGYGGSSSTGSGGSAYSGSRPAAPGPPKPQSGSSGGGGPLSGIASRLGGKKDKPAQSKGASGGGGGPLSGITSRLGGGEKGAKKDKPAQPKGSGGGFLGRFTGQKKDSASSRPASSAPGSAYSSPRSTSAAPGYGGSSYSSSSGRASSAPAAGARPRSSGDKSAGGLGARLGALLPFGRQSAARRPATTREKLERASRTPKVEGSGLSLDTQLDILGVALLIGALLLFFSSISTTKGQLTEPVLTAVAQTLGWGAWAVPLAMFAAGLWLVVRHFGERAPVIDPVRLSGLGLLYISAMTIFQYIDSYRSLYTFSALDDFLQLSILDGRGGGWVGAQLYKLLVTNFTEIGGIFILIGMIIVGIMLLLRISASELAVFLISIGRSFSDARRRRAQKRAAAARLAEVERAAALAAQAQSQVKVSKPAAGELAEGRPAAALPAASATQEALPLPEPRPIPITMGGRTFTAFYGDEADEAADLVPAAGAAPAGKPAQRGGLTARVRAALPGRQSAGKPAPAAAAPAAAAAAPAAAGDAPAAAGGAAAAAVTAGAAVAVGTAGALGRRLFGGRASPAADQPASTPAPAQPVAALPEPALTAPAPQVTPFSAAPASAPTPAPDTAAPAAPAAPAASDEPLAELVRRPPRRNPVTGELQTPSAPSAAQPAASAAAPSSDSDQPSADSDPAHLPPATPKGTVRAAPAPAPHPATAAPATLAERRARLDAIRAGERPASAPPAAPTAPAAPERPTPAATPAGSAAIAAAAAPAAPFRKPDGPPAAGPLPPTNQPAAATPARPRKTWKLPDYRTLLNSGSESDFDRETLLQRARIIEETLQSFGAPGRVVEVNTGPVITQFGVEPDYLVGRSGKKSRVKVGAIAQLDKDLQLALGAKSIRIEAPVPGKGYVGIEVPNDRASLVSLRDVMDSDEFKRIRAKSPLAIALGQSVDGAPISADLGSMPHLLIAGTTGSGKSVCVNSIIGCLILSNPPDRVKFIMVDPKRVELTGYNGIPHLVAPVVVDLERIVGVLKWVTREMDERYKRFSSAGARNIEDYNNHLQPDQEIMPYIIVIIDELADLMMLAPDETERVITRIAALARATGIHLVIATQRPSVDVVTGLIKANFPARIAFAVAGGVDSRVILDQPGAERLLGRGDMLYMSGNSPAPVRLQGVFLSDAEINNITRYWKMFTADADQPRPITALIGDDSLSETARDVMPRGPLAQRAFWDRDRNGGGADDDEDEDDDSDGVGEDGVDELYDEAVELVRRLNKASVSLLQRRLRIGYTRAARLIDMMEEEGIVGPAQEGAKPREVLSQRG